MPTARKRTAYTPVRVPLLSLNFYSNNFSKVYIVESDRKNQFTRNRNVYGILENSTYVPPIPPPVPLRMGFTDEEFRGHYAT